VHLVSAGVCVVEQERLVGPLAADELEARRKRGDKSRVETRNINGQQTQVLLFEPPSNVGTASLSSGAVSGAAVPVSAASTSSTAPLLASDSPPSIARSLAQGLLQGGISWAHRFRTGTHDEEQEEPAAAISVVESNGSQVDLSVQNAAPAPLPPSQIQLVRPASVTASTSASLPVDASSTPASPVGAGRSTTTEHALPPDALILPAVPAAHHPSKAHDAMPDSHHLLNVHVDNEATAPSSRTHEPGAASLAASSGASGTASTSSVSPLSPPDFVSGSLSSSPLLPMDDEDDADWSELDDALDEAAAEPNLAIARTAATDAPPATGVPAGSSLDTDADLRRWQEDRDARRAAKRRVRAERRAADAAAAEKKRIMSMSALERQFGQHVDAKKKPQAPQAELSKVSSAGTALTPGDQSASAATGGPSAHDLSATGGAAANSMAGATPAPHAIAVAADSATPGRLSSTNTSLVPFVSALPSLPAFERHSSVVGYVRSGRLIGEMCLVAPSVSASSSAVHLASSPAAAAGALADSSYSIAPASVTTKEATRVLTWPKERLQRLFFRLPSLAVGWYSVVSTDLVNRLQAARASAHTSAYRHILLGVLSDGEVSVAQKELLARYRAQYAVSTEYHTRALQELGWTTADFERGHIHRGWLSNWFRGSGGNQPPAML
jgi:hypothetical protein